MGWVWLKCKKPDVKYDKITGNIIKLRANIVKIADKYDKYLGYDKNYDKIWK